MTTLADAEDRGIISVSCDIQSPDDRGSLRLFDDAFAGLLNGMQEISVSSSAVGNSPYTRTFMALESAPYFSSISAMKSGETRENQGN